MKQDELEKLAEHYRELAQKAMQNYQETGQQRFYSQYVRNDDLASAIQMAADAVNEHEKYMQMRFMICDFAMRAADILTEEWDDHKIESLLRSLAVYGRGLGWRIDIPGESDDNVQ